MPSFLVAGAGGFIGSHVVVQLRREGHAVVALDRPGADLSVARDAGALPVAVDLDDELGLRRALTGVSHVLNATGLFDLAAAPEALSRINVQGALALALAARDAGAARLVHLSSVAVYGRPARTPMTEDGPFRPRNAYEETKLAGERAVGELHGKGLAVAIVRPTLVYGPRSRYGQALFIGLLAQLRALGWRRFPLLAGGPLAQHVHVSDVARAAILCATHPDAAGQAFNVADREPLGLGDTFEALILALGLVPSPRLRSRLAWRLALFGLAHLPGFALRAFNRRLLRGHEHFVRHGLCSNLVPRLDREWLSYFDGDFVFDTSRLERLGFQWQHPDLRTSIAGVVAWYEQAGWLPTPDSTLPAAPPKAVSP